MANSALKKPTTDPLPIFEHFRGSYGTELLTAAVAHFRIFERLGERAKPYDLLRQELELAPRPMVVLTTALKAMGLLTQNAAGELALTPVAREHLLPGGPFDVSEYVGLAAHSPGVAAMIERLESNRPAQAEEQDQGAAFIFREGLESAMDQADSARRLTLALAGRAKNVAPFVAEQADLNKARCLLDIGGGTGIYAIACWQKFPHLRAIVWDRAEVLKVAQEFAGEYGVADRLQCLPGDMFADPIPAGCDAMLLSNILHDWDVPECQQLVNRCAAQLPASGQLLIHDVFLNDALDGPLPLALYSAALFTITEGRAYSAAEYRAWLIAAGLQPQPVRPTYVHCGLLSGIKP